MSTQYIDINKALVDRCKAGDSKAQYELYHIYARSMFSICMRMVNHEGEAEDILQEAFLDAFNNIDKFRGESTIGAWLKRIVINKSVNFLRKKRLVLFEEVPDKEATLPDHSNYDHEEQSWEVKKVLKAIGELTEGYRLVLTLYLIEGYDHGEIAQILNITETTSKTQYNRAKNKVREKLNVTYYER